MKSLFTFIICLFYVTTVQAQKLGLSGGEVFESQRLEGRVSVYCRSAQGQDFAVYSCRENRLTPEEWDHFTHPDKVQGDEVTLVSHQQSGKVREKSEDYDPRTGESENFNLWVATLFQRPLLDYGLNRIDYEVTKEGIVQDMGSFDVRVEKRDEVRRCPARTYYSSWPSDCRSGFQICQRYFRELNDCR